MCIVIGWVYLDFCLCRLNHVFSSFPCCSCMLFQMTEQSNIHKNLCVLNRAPGQLCLWLSEQFPTQWSGPLTHADWFSWGCTLLSFFALFLFPYSLNLWNQQGSILANLKKCWSLLLLHMLSANLIVYLIFRLYKLWVWSYFNYMNI